MKVVITYPREKRNIRLSKVDAGVLYFIVGCGVGKEWRLMDFWDLPYTFRRYADARIGAKKISKQMKKYEWEDQKAVIVKLSL